MDFKNPAQKQHEILWQISEDAFSPSGWFLGTLQLQEDSLSMDDVYFLAMRQRSKKKILCLYGDPAFMDSGKTGFFLKRSAPEELDFWELSRLKEADLNHYAGILLGHAKKISPEDGDILLRAVQAGKGLWIIPSKDFEPGGLQSLSPLLPGQLGKLKSSSESKGSPLRLENPALGFQWKDFELEKIRVLKYYETVPQKNSIAWLSTLQEPLLLETSGPGKILLSAFSLDWTCTNFALKPAFPLFLRHLLDHLAGNDLSQMQQLEIDAPYERAWSLPEQMPVQAWIQTPNQKRTKPVRQGPRLKFSDTTQPGLYTLEIPQNQVLEEEYFAVNLDRRSQEGDLTPAAPIPWKNLKFNRLQEDFQQYLYGIEMTSSLLGIVLLLFMMETLLAFPKGRERFASSRNFGKFLSCILCLGFLSPLSAEETEASRITWTELRIGEIQPPAIYPEIFPFLRQTTSLHLDPQPRVLTLRDDRLFSAPFLVLRTDSALPELEDGDIYRLRAYLISGGFLWIEDTSGQKISSFDRWVKKTLGKVFPDTDLQTIPSQHVLFKTFYLIRSLGGRVMVQPSLQGILWGRRLAVLYSRNDILGAWRKDHLGHFLFPCVPRGEAQRWDAQKLTVNILFYALTGSYKEDAVHQPFLLEKLRREPIP
ncbi:MAG: DUF4159 domain-containing protein [Elusimicrobia bacterium]|nr:DUF4159 domain-containing protein [Elusimicrobiota bacterium]